MTSRYSLLTILLLVLIFYAEVEVSAQEYPNPLFHARQFNSTVSFRQNVCERQQQYHMGQIERLDDALEGLELRTILVAVGTYFWLDDEGRIPEDYPGLMAVLLDEVARRGKFTWRNSFNADFNNPAEGKTYTDLLMWTADTYDLTASWWDHTLDRVTEGIAFPQAWYDSSLILIGKSDLGSDDDQFNAWSWLAPFDKQVWMLILATIICSGILYTFLESIDPYSDKRSLHKKPLETIYMSAMGLAGHMEFEAQTHPARLFTVSLAMWALLIEDAVRRGAPICVWAGTGSVEQLRKDYPNAAIVEKSEEEDTYQGVIDGDCQVALAYTSSWHSFERDSTVNKDCQLQWIGRKYKDLPAGFATTTDSGIKCTGLIRDVFNIHMLRMKEEGFIEQAWEQHLQRSQSIHCDAPQATSNTRSRSLKSGGGKGAGGGGESGTFEASDGGGSSDASSSLEAQQLNIKNTGGIFLMHGGLSCIAIIFALVHRFIGLQARRDKERQEKNLRRHLKRSQSMKTLQLSNDPEEKRRALLDVLMEYGSDDVDKFLSGSGGVGNGIGGEDSPTLEEDQFLSSFRNHRDHLNGNNDDNKFLSSSVRTHRTVQTDDTFNNSVAREDNAVVVEHIKSRQDQQMTIQNQQMEAIMRLEQQMSNLTSLLVGGQQSQNNRIPVSSVGMDGSIQSTEGIHDDRV